MQFDSLDDIRAFCRDLPGGDERAAEAAARRQQNLTKPPGSLGRLEELAIWLARWQARELPRLERVTIAVFAGNHGVAARGVSAYPQAVTAQMVANFAAGGAAINQIAKLAGAELRVVPIELDRPTRDFTVAAAMERGRVSRCGRYRLSHRAGGLRSARRRRDGNRQHDDRGDAVRGAARRRRRALGRPRHRRRRRRAGAQARGDRRRAELSSRHSRTIRWRWRRRSAAASSPRSPARCSPRGAITFPCCSTGSWRPRRCCRWRALRRARSIIAAPGTFRPNPAIANCCANSGSTPLLDLNMRLGEASGRRRRDPAAARRAGLPRRDGDICGSRRVRRGRLTKPCAQAAA